MKSLMLGAKFLPVMAVMPPASGNTTGSMVLSTGGPLAGPPRGDVTEGLRAAGGFGIALSSYIHSLVLPLNIRGG